MTREEAIRWLEIEKSIIREVPEQPQGARELTEAYNMAIEALHQKGAYEQTKWERDVALQTLEEHGIGLGQKVEHIIPNGGVMFTSADCSTCKHNDKDWDSVECDSCCGNNNHYESAEADMSEYADRLWKIAYERGKREASAKANPTVVRYKTMIPYGDFREWAKRIREDNPNVIVIPFDAEVTSADAVHGEWVDVENEPYCECSVCGSYIDNLDDDYAFCPRCGARMKGGDDE